MAITLHYYRSDPPNFGDELNTLVWRALVPELEKTERDGVLVGIGTILDGSIPRDRDIFVVGTGAGLVPTPPDLLTSRFHIMAVRGPLTAALAGLPADLAVTDPALLLRVIYPQLLRAPGRPAGRTIFVPHFTTAKDEGWRRACTLAGVEFVDPTGSCNTILKKIASARLVIAEAMHAAIVADAFRVPWTPVSSTRHFSTFKWVDWALSLQVPYRPTVLPAVSVRHKCQRAWLSLFAERCVVDGVSTGSGEAEVHSETVSRLLRDTARRLESQGSATSLWFRMKAAAVYKRILDPLVAWLSPGLLRAFDGPMEHRMGRVLSELAAAPGYLSGEKISAARLKTLVERVDLLRSHFDAGEPAAARAASAHIRTSGRTRTKFE